MDKREIMNEIANKIDDECCKNGIKYALLMIKGDTKYYIHNTIGNPSMEKIVKLTRKILGFDEF